MNSRLIITYVTLIAFFGLIAFAYINRSTHTNYVAVETGELEDKVKQIISENPELILETLMSFQAQEIEVQKQKSEQGVLEVYNKAIADKSLARIGKGNIKVVEFYDYVCGYCKTMRETKNKLSRRGVEFILIENPVLGGDSVYLAKASIAMRILNPNKFEEIHMEILSNTTMAPKTLVQSILEKYGIDEKEFYEMMKSDKVTSKLAKGTKYAKDAGIYATPAYLIDGKLYMGALPQNRFEEIIRNSKSR